MSSVPIQAIIRFLLICTFISSFASCKTPYDGHDTAIPVQEQQRLDSMKITAQKTVPDSALAIYQQIRSVARDKHYDEELFQAYCKAALIVTSSKNDFSQSKKLLDSAAALSVVLKDPRLYASLLVRYGLIYRQSDSALYYFKKALEHPELLSNEDRLLASGSISILFTEYKNYDLARQYALLFLDENRKSTSLSRIKDEVVMLNNLYLIGKGMGDTAHAIRYLRQAVQLVDDSMSNTGYLVVYQNMGKYYLQAGKTDSARVYFEKFNTIIKRDFQYQQEYNFYPLLYFAEVSAAGSDYRASYKYLRQASLYLQSDTARVPVLKSDTTILEEYYETLYRVLKAQNQAPRALAALETRNHYNNILQGRAKDEQLLRYEKQLKQAAAEKEIADKQRKLERQQNITRSLVAVCILLLVLATVTVQYWRKKKQLESQRLNELQQKTELERTHLLLQAESSERKRIARELHDELGSTLTSIGLAVEVLKQQQKTIPPAQHPLEILARNSQKLNSQTNEIVWSLNDGNDSLPSLIAYIRKHCNQFLKDAGIAFHYKEVRDIPDTPIEGYKRRYIFQAVKELVNNAVKHSKAQTITIHISVSTSLHIDIADNGVGMQDADDRTAGNGLRNVNNNLAAIGGKVSWGTNDPGTKVQLDIPL